MPVLSAHRPTHGALPEGGRGHPVREREARGGLAPQNHSFAAMGCAIQRWLPQPARGAGSPTGAAASPTSPKGGKESVPCRLGATCRRFMQGGAAAFAFSHAETSASPWVAGRKGDLPPSAANSPPRVAPPSPSASIGYSDSADAQGMCFECGKLREDHADKRLYPRRETLARAGPSTTVGARGRLAAGVRGQVKSEGSPLCGDEATFAVPGLSQSPLSRVVASPCGPGGHRSSAGAGGRPQGRLGTAFPHGLRASSCRSRGLRTSWRRRSFSCRYTRGFPVLVPRRCCISADWERFRLCTTELHALAFMKKSLSPHRFPRGERQLTPKFDSRGYPREHGPVEDRYDDSEVPNMDEGAVLSRGAPLFEPQPPAWPSNQSRLAPSNLRCKRKMGGSERRVKKTHIPHVSGARTRRL